MSGEALPEDLRPAATSVEGIRAWPPETVARAIAHLAASSEAPVRIQAWVCLVRDSGEFTYTHIVGSTPDEARIYQWDISTGRDEATESWQGFCTRAAAEATAWLAACTAPADVQAPWGDRLAFGVWVEVR